MWHNSIFTTPAVDLLAIYPEYVKLVKENIYAAEYEYSRKPIMFTGVIESIGEDRKKDGSLDLFCGYNATTSFTYQSENGPINVKVKWLFNGIEDIAKIRIGKKATLKGNLSADKYDLKLGDPNSLLVIGTKTVGWERSDNSEQSCETKVVCPYACMSETDKTSTAFSPAIKEVRICLEQRYEKELTETVGVEGAYCPYVTRLFNKLKFNGIIQKGE